MVVMRRQVWRQEAPDDSAGAPIWARHEYVLVTHKEILVPDEHGRLSPRRTAIAQPFPCLVHYFLKEDTAVPPRAKRLRPADASLLDSSPLPKIPASLSAVTSSTTLFSPLQILSNSSSSNSSSNSSSHFNLLHLPSSSSFDQLLSSSSAAASSSISSSTPPPPILASSHSTHSSSSPSSHSSSTYHLPNLSLISAHDYSPERLSLRSPLVVSSPELLFSESLQQPLSSSCNFDAFLLSPDTAAPLPQLDPLDTSRYFSSPDTFSFLSNTGSFGCDPCEASDEEPFDADPFTIRSSLAYEGDHFLEDDT